MNIEQEREAFKKHYGALFDLTETPDAWGNPRFAHESVEAIWYGWRDRATLQHRPSHAGWKEAFKAWKVCASIHRELANGKDAVFTTRQADFVRHAENAFKKAMDTGALQSQDRDAPFLQEEDQHALCRFIETAEDGEGYDIGKDRIKRLAELGAISNHGFGRYSVTAFGSWCHENHWHQNPPLPLKTIDERNAQAAIDHARRVEGGKQ